MLILITTKASDAGLFLTYVKWFLTNKNAKSIKFMHEIPYCGILKIFDMGIYD